MAALPWNRRGWNTKRQQSSLSPRINHVKMKFTISFIIKIVYQVLLLQTHTCIEKNQFRHAVNFIPDSRCTRLLLCTCRRCPNLLLSFPPLGRNNSRRHGRNTGRLWWKTPGHRHTQTQILFYLRNKLPPIFLSTFKNLKPNVNQINLKYKVNKTEHLPSQSLLDVYEWLVYWMSALTEL